MRGNLFRDTFPYPRGENSSERDSRNLNSMTICTLKTGIFKKSWKNPEIPLNYSPQCANILAESNATSFQRKENIMTDGIYFLHPEGSGWIAARFKDGQLVDTAEQFDAETHRAANDRWAGCVPSEDDTEVHGRTGEDIIVQVLGSEVFPEMVVVTKS